MRIFATADLHGELPEVPECDLLLIGGDICPAWDNHSPIWQREWLGKYFREWLESIPAKNIVGIAGNHDFVFENRFHPRDLPWVYLQDSATTIEGVNIWGTPWSPWFYDWAFNAPQHDAREKFLRAKWAAIPEDTDILLVHGPPHGYGDRTRRNGEHVGAKSLNDTIQRVRPRAVVCGHIHEGYGAYRHRGVDGTMVYNASLMDADYEPVNKLVEIVP